jgi:hypothetical protein
VPHPFPSPSERRQSRNEVFVAYLEYFRAQVVGRVEALSPTDQRSSRLASGWTPVELLKHLQFVELRWLVWGFVGDEVSSPWGDRVADRWHVDDGESVEELVAALWQQAATSDAIIVANNLETLGQPGPRWDGSEPASLERILLHLLQEYARHLGHLDIVCELSGGPVGE